MQQFMDTLDLILKLRVTDACIENTAYGKNFYEENFHV